MTQNDNHLLQMHPQDFVSFLKKEDIRAFNFVYDRNGQRVVPSHAVLKPLAEFIEADTRDFMQHEGLFFHIEPQTDVLLGAFLHRTCRGQGAGGVRYWEYDSMEAYLRDGLRLSKGMTRKNALAGLWWGGGKGVMAHNPVHNKRDPEIRSTVYQAFGRLMSSLRGCYVTAEDVGTNVEDMAKIFSQTRFTTCIPSTLGGSGNPSIPTARGVICGMEAALEFLGMGSLEGKVIAVQGMGNVGLALIGYLFERGVKKVLASDISAERVREVSARFKGQNFEAKVADRSDHSILAAVCDIVAPCATGAVLNPNSIQTIQAKIVCGAANNQLEDAERDDRLLFERGILYVPDFLTNRMGIVNCANEQYGYVKNDPLFEKHLSKDWEFSIYQTTLRVLRECKSKGQPPAKVSIQQADELSLQPHPIFGHRGKQIIDSLVADRWHEL